MSEESLVGQTIAGKYRVEKILGKGGMGVVFGARHLKLDEPVAIKVLKPAMMEVAGMVTRFLREARLASKIKSEHVVRVTDVDTLEDGVPYMVMEYLEGIDFSELRKQKGTFEVSEAVGYVVEACAAIAEAHELGIVHRDLKPGNLFLHKRRDGRRVVKVLDFGISKVDAPGEQDTTKTGQMMGSPKYMSPEQMTSMRDVDGRTDIWSLGAILYELLCGRPPFLADTTPRICALVLNNDPPLPSTLRPDLPAEIEQVLLRCLEKEPDCRFSDVSHLVEALAPWTPVPEVFSSGTRPQVSPPSSTPQPVAVESVPVEPRAATPSATPAATVAAWDTTKDEGPPKKTAQTRRLAAPSAALLLIGAAYGGYAMRGGPPPPPPVNAVSAPPITALPAFTASPLAASAEPIKAAEPVKPAVSPSDLPDATATAAPIKPPPAASASAVVKKPKAAPSVDPFGGRRN
ncbi:MAG: serine/threonine-protein kinase [Minicystis sp.]